MDRARTKGKPMTIGLKYRQILRVAKENVFADLAMLRAMTFVHQFHNSHHTLLIVSHKKRLLQTYPVTTVACIGPVHKINRTYQVFIILLRTT
jgi:hypothetical protein